MSNQTSSSIRQWAAVTATAILIVGCGGGGGGGGGGSPAILDGEFLDSPVQGMTYESGSAAGVTDAAGRFRYEEGQAVTFLVGDIIIGNGLGKATMTPVDLVPGALDTSNANVVNIAQFLQSLDDNANPADGILITSLQRDLAQGRTIDFSQSEIDFQDGGNVQIVVADLTAPTSAGSRELVSRMVAKSHLDSTLEELAGVLPDVRGTYTGTAMATNTGCSDPEINTDFQADVVVEISGQSGSSFTGATAIELNFMGDVFTGTDMLSGSVGANGQISGEIDGVFVDTQHAGTFSGSISGNTLTYNYDTTDTDGETCATSGQVNATRQ